jgi:hypothetical protein
MNNIHEKDWASEDNWGGHSGMGNDSDYSRVEDEQNEIPISAPGVTRVPGALSGNPPSHQ